MNGPSWLRVKEVLEATLARPPEERSSFVSKTCGDDSDLRTEVESLLTAINESDNFIQPASQSLSLSAAFPAGWIPDLGHRALQPGNCLGPYTILEFVAAGGMGEVYRAHDSNLNRDVALKVRPPAFALDDDRFVRFRREAQIVAALNHPNIAAIHGFENSGGVQALVLELVEGPTLASRIVKGRIRIGEALSIAQQIAEGVGAAHKRGIVHSDLKPANIKLRPDGTVKILDFGLARALDASHTNAAMSGATAVFGTAAYMSPEQARGDAIDKRSDVWAFGCVLYEMLSGRPAFRGDDVEEILAAVQNREPDWDLLPTEIPSAVSRLLRRCLEKTADRRLHDIADARIEIEDEIEAVASSRASTAVARAGRRSSWLTTVGVAAVVIGGGAWGWVRLVKPPPQATSRAKRFQISLPDEGRTASLPFGIGQLSIAVAPDGAHLAYVLTREGVTQLYVRGIDEWNARPIPQTDGAFAPFFSPDGRWLGFFVGKTLKKVAVSGGEPIALCEAPNAYGGSWGTDGTILFAPDEGRHPARVPETGGIPQPIRVTNSGGSFRQPDILPGGKAAIVSNPLLGQVGVLSFDSGEFRALVDRAGGGRYASSGHLIFARSGSLLAVPFDSEKLAVTGPESVILEGVRMDAAGPIVPQAVFTRDGMLVYAPGSVSPGAVRPVWVDRRGNAKPLGLPPGLYGSFSLSPDGTRLAIVIMDPDANMWVQDLARGDLKQVTSGFGIGPIAWTPDGKYVVFNGGRRVSSDLNTTAVPRRTPGRATPFRVLPDGNGEPERLFREDGPAPGLSFSPDGRLLAFFRGNPASATGNDLFVRRLDGDQSTQPFLATRFAEGGPKFSPDGRWISYSSDESGRSEIYVRPYPGPGRAWPVSTDGGMHQIWSRDGKELFYRNGQKWMSAAVHLTPEFTTEKPRLLFEGPYVMFGGQDFDVTPDGRRFLALEPMDAGPVTHFDVVLNWFDEVRQKAASTAKPMN
jgi:serine/threonine-protein kinase